MASVINEPIREVMKHEITPNEVRHWQALILLLMPVTSTYEA
jgi:hypothetical protein